MITYYIEAYYPDGRPLLGNGDGQTVLHGIRYPERTAAWKRILANPSPRVGEYRIVRVIGNPYGAGSVVRIHRPA